MYMYYWIYHHPHHLGGGQPKKKNAKRDWMDAHTHSTHAQTHTHTIVK